MSYKINTPVGLIPYSFTPDGELVLLLWKSSTSTFHHSSVYYGECLGVQDRRDTTLWDVCARTWGEISGGLYHFSQDLQKKREKRESKDAKTKKQLNEKGKSKSSKSAALNDPPTESSTPRGAFAQAECIDTYTPAAANHTTVYSTNGKKYQQFIISLSSLSQRRAISSSIKAVRKLLTSHHKSVITWSSANPQNPRLAYLIPIEYLPIWQYNAYLTKFGRGECRWLSIREVIRIYTVQCRFNARLPPYSGAQHHSDDETELLTVYPYVDQETVLGQDQVDALYNSLADTNSEVSKKKFQVDIPAASVSLSLSFLSMLTPQNLLTLMKMARVSKKVLPQDVYSVMKSQMDKGQQNGAGADSDTSARPAPQTQEQIDQLEEDIRTSNYLYKCRSCRHILFTEADLALHSPFSLEHHTQKALDRITQRENNREATEHKREIRSIRRSITDEVKRLTKYVLRRGLADFQTSDFNEDETGDAGDEGLYNYVFSDEDLSDDDDEDPSDGDDQDEDDIDDDLFAEYDSLDDMNGLSLEDDGDSQDTLLIPYRRLLQQSRKHQIDLDISSLELEPVNRDGITPPELEARYNLLGLRSQLLDAMLSYRDYIRRRDAPPEENEQGANTDVDDTQPEIVYTEREIQETLPTYQGPNTAGAGLYVKPVFGKHSQKGFTSKSSHVPSSVPTASDITTSSVCQSFFLDSNRNLPFLKPMHDLEGEIQCNQCDFRCGTYSWSGSQCSCGQWVVPGLQIPASRVDTVLRSQPVSDHTQPVNDQPGSQVFVNPTKVLPKQVGVRRLPAHRPPVKRPQ